MGMQPGMQGNMQSNAMPGMQGNMGQMPSGSVGQIPGSNVGPGQSGPNPINQAFTPEMLQQFKSQIIAYKLLSRNQVLPDNILTSAIGKRGAQGNFQSPTQGPTPTAASQMQSGQKREPTAKAPQPKTPTAATSGGSHLFYICILQSPSPGTVEGKDTNMITRCTQSPWVERTPI